MPTEITLKDIMKYFGMSTAEFSKSWKLMSPQDKTDIKAGLTDGSLNY